MDHNENHWRALKGLQIRNEYDRFLKAEGLEPSPHNAELFAKKKTAGTGTYGNMTERQLILLLTGKLRYLYD